jgi:hypothetical protein
MRFAMPLAVVVFSAALVTLAAGGPGGDKGFKNRRTQTQEEPIEGPKLAGAQNRDARGALLTHDGKVRDVGHRLRNELLGQMKDILSESDLKALTDEFDQAMPAPAFPPNPRAAPGDLVDQLTAFDKNGAGKVTKDELPERLRGLIEEGDLNGDGALDRGEIRRLAERDTPRPPR